MVACEFQDTHGNINTVDVFMDMQTVCGIFHDHVKDVEVPGIEGEFYTNDFASLQEVNKTHVNSAKLSCGHTFSLSALLTHFVSVDMRCPLCRSGPPGRLSLSCLSVELARKLEIKKQHMHVPPEVLVVDPNAIISDLTFAVELVAFPAVGIIRSPVQLLTPTDNTDSGFRSFRFQRCFTRTLSSWMQSFAECHMTNMRGVVLLLHHPCIPHCITSDLLAFEQFHSAVSTNIVAAEDSTALNVDMQLNANMHMGSFDVKRSQDSKILPFISISLNVDLLLQLVAAQMQVSSESIIQIAPLRD